MVESQFKLNASGATDIGLVRRMNQDSFLCDIDRGLFVVADGMGGHAGGEIASQLCVATIADIFSQKHWESPPAGLDSVTHWREKFLADAVNRASMKIFERAIAEHSLRGMGTTATVLAIKDGTGFYAHVGDSRLYLLRAGLIYQITSDHSLVSEQIRAGVLDPSEAERHHLRNVITRSVGYQEEEDVDTGQISLQRGDQLILCSDGLHGKISHELLVDLIHSHDLSSVSKMIEAAKKNGGEDNITVVLVAIQGMD